MFYTPLYAKGEAMQINDNMSAEAIKSIDRTVMASGRCLVERLRACGMWRPKVRGGGVGE